MQPRFWVQRCAATSAYRDRETGNVVQILQGVGRAQIHIVFFLRIETTQARPPRCVSRTHCGNLVFLAPDLHPVAVERNEILDAGDRLERLLVAPSHVVRARVAHTERPVGGVSLVRSAAGMSRAAQEVDPDLVSREVENWCVPDLEHDHGVGCVDDCCAREYHAYVPYGGLKRYWKAGSGVKSGRRASVA